MITFPPPGLGRERPARSAGADLDGVLTRGRLVAGAGLIVVAFGAGAVTRYLREYPTHVKGHPPLPMLILWILRWTGLGTIPLQSSRLVDWGDKRFHRLWITLYQALVRSPW